MGAPRRDPRIGPARARRGGGRGRRIAVSVWQGHQAAARCFGPTTRVAQEHLEAAGEPAVEPPTSPRSARTPTCTRTSASNLTYGIPYGLCPRPSRRCRSNFHRLRRPVRQGPISDSARAAGRGRRELERADDTRARGCSQAAASCTELYNAQPNSDGSWNAGSGAVVSTCARTSFRPNAWTPRPRLPGLPDSFAG